MHIAVVGPMDVGRLAQGLTMRVIGDAPVPTGHGGHSVTELVLALAPLVERLDLVTLDPGLVGPVELEGPGVRLSVGPFRPRARTRSRDLFAVERAFIAERLRTWDPSAVSAHWTYEYALGALDSGRPTLITVRDWAPTILRHATDAYRLVRLAMQALVFARGRHFAAVSPYMARKIEMITRRPAAVLPNCLGGAWIRDEPPKPDGQRVIAVNAGFGRRKNVKRLLEAWALVRRRCPDGELLLVGTGYEPCGEAARWATDAGLSEGVQFVGSVGRSDLPELLASARLLAHPALEESFGMVLVEAMAVGIPVLGGQSSGAVPWVLEDGAGVLVDVRDPGAIADGIVALITDEDHAAQTAARGNRRVRDHFTAAVTAERYVACLGSVATAGR